MLENYPSITIVEITNAHNLGMAALAELAVQEAMKDQYAIDLLVCEEADFKECLYLYLYALDSWDNTEGAYNVLTEAQLIKIITRIEQLHKVCCNSNTTTGTVLPPVPPLVKNGTWVEADPLNPLTIAELAEDTGGTLLWYTVPTGGTGSPTAPNTPDTFPGVYNYWVSQVNSAGESKRLPVDVTIIPKAITVSNYTSCQSLTPGSHIMVFSGLDAGGTLQVYQGGTLIGTGLTVDLTIVQNITYTVTQLVVGLESAPTPFTVLINAAPITASSITGNATPKVNDTFTYTIPPIAGAVSYIWALPVGVTGASTTNSIDLTFGTLGLKTISVRGVSSAGCLGNIVTYNITVDPGLITTHFTNQTNEVFVNRVYTVRQHLQANPTDTITIVSVVVDNPVGATITVNPLSVTGVTTDMYTDISIDASATYLGGTVQVQLTITASALGATIDSPSVVLIQVPFASAPHCAAGYTLSMDGTYCFKTETMSPTITNLGYCVVASQIIEYTEAFSRIYNVGFSNASLSTYTPAPGDVFAVMSNVPQWRGNTGTNGPMNRAGVWIDSDCNGTKDSLLAGQKVTLAYAYNNVGPTRLVYVGIGADNEFTLTLNGTIIANAMLGYPAHFKIWHLIPVTIQNGTNYFNVVATGDGSVNDSVGMIIYDNTALQLQNAVDDTTLTILFSTGSLIGQTIDIVTCAPGWSLDTSGGPGFYLCKRTLITPPIP